MNEPDLLRCYVKLPTVLAVELTVDGTVGPIDWLSFKVKMKRVVQGSICSLDTCKCWVLRDQMLSEADGWQLRERKSKEASPLASFLAPPSFFIHFSFFI